jgi:hypothetical protein
LEGEINEKYFFITTNFTYKLQIPNKGDGYSTGGSDGRAREDLSFSRCEAYPR